MLAPRKSKVVKSACCIRVRLCHKTRAVKFTRIAGFSLLTWFVVSCIYNLIDIRDQEQQGDAPAGPVELAVTEEPAPRILCYVLLAQTKLQAGKVIRRTWGSQCDGIVFYGHFKYTSPELNVTFINAREGYPYLWNKTKSALLHLHKNYAHMYDWFLKADDDTFVLVDNLRQFVRQLDSNLPIWTGFRLRSTRMKQAYMSGGAGYLFSIKALNRIVGLLQMRISSPTQLNYNESSKDICNTESDIGYEDLEVGKCFNQAGVQQISSLDSKGRHRFLPLPLQQLLNDEISSFHWLRYQSWDKLNFGRRCCSPVLITIHKVSSSEMSVLHFLLYNVTHLSNGHRTEKVTSPLKLN